MSLSRRPHEHPPTHPGHGAPGPGKLPITELLGMKESHSPIAMITAYDAPSGRLADAAGVDMILVGDSAAMTCWATTPRCP